MQLTGLLGVTIVMAAAPAYSDGTVTSRGYYYKERATRVVQPMIDADFEVDDDTQVGAHFLLDAITSASVAAGAADVAFTERRYEAGANAAKGIGDKFTLGASTRFSYEPDYRSIFLGFSGQAELAQKNTILRIAGGFGDDAISTSSQGGLAPDPLAEELNTYLASGGVDQIFSKTLIAGITYDFIYLDGYQANPYRSVIAGGVVTPERAPQTRMRHAMRAHFRQYVIPFKATLMSSYRFYIDDWGIISHTPEVRWVQEIGDSVLLHGRFRYYWQKAADFYKPIYDSPDPMVEPFLTDDPKLSAFDGYTVGGKLEMKLSVLGFGGFLGKMTGIANFDYIVQNNRFGNAISGSVGLQAPISF